MSNHFPYFRPKRATANPPADKPKREDLTQTRNLSAKQRVLRMAGFKRQKITLPIVKLPD